MNYENLANAYLDIESTSGLLEKIDVFTGVLKDADAEEISKVIALTRGKLHPDWKGEPEIGIAEKMTVRVVAAAASVPESKVVSGLRRHGDIGLAAEELLSQTAQSTLVMHNVTVDLVFASRDSREGGGTTKVQQMQPQLVN